MEQRSIRHVFMTADTIGGVWTYALDLVRAYEKRNILVSLATMGAPLNEYQQEQISQLSNLKVYQGLFKLEWMDHCWDDIDEAADWLLQLEEELQPDLVHLNQYCHAGLPFRSPVLVVAHSDVLSWWQAVKGEEAPAEWQTYQERIRQNVHAATELVAVSEAYARDFKRYYGDQLEIKVIPNGREASDFSNHGKTPRIFGMGRLWDEGKNLSLLARAASAVQAPVFLAGDATDPVSGRSSSFRNVQLLGRLSEKQVAQWLSGSMIYVLPAKYEPFGLSALEAALSGCVLVLSDIPTLKEIWQDAAVFVDPQDEKELARVLNELLEDPGKRKRLVEKSIRRAHNYSLSAMADAYLELYQKMLTKTEVQPIETL